jgi:thioredoxin 1
MKKKKTGIYIVLGLILIIGLSALISNLTTKEEKEVLNAITYSEYKDFYKSNDLEFVYVGRPGCGYCQMTRPFLEELQDEEKMVWNYLNTDTMTQSDFDDIAKTADAFAGEWGTPTLLAIKDGKVLNSIAGYREKDVLKSFIESSKEGKEWKEETK